MLDLIGGALRATAAMGLVAAVLIVVAFLTSPAADEAEPAAAVRRKLQTPVYAAVPLRDGRTYAAVHWNSMLSVGDVSGRRPPRPVALDGPRPLCLAPSPADDRVLLGCGDGSILVWRARNDGALLEPFGKLPAPIRAVAFSPGGERLCAATERTVGVWDSRTSRGVTWRVGRGQAIDDVQFSYDGRRLVIRDCDGAIAVWEPQRRSALTRIPCGDVGNGRLCGSPVSPLVAWGGRIAEGTGVQICDIDAGTRLWSAALDPIPGLSANPVRMAFSADGRLLVCGCGERLVVFDGATGAKRAQARVAGHTITSLSFLADGSILLSSMEGSIQSRDVETLEIRWMVETEPASGA